MIARRVFALERVAKTLGIPVTEDLITEVQRDQVRALKAHSVVGSAMGIVGVVILGVWLQGTIPEGGVLALILLKIVSAMPRLPGVASHYFRWLERGNRQWTFETQLALDGMVWGGFSVAAIWGSETAAAVVGAVLVGVSSVAAVGLQVRMSACLAFVLPIHLSLMACYAARADQFAMSAITGIAVLMYAQAVTVYRAQRRYLEMLLLGRLRRERDFVIGAVNHELRTPLQAIVGSAELLEVKLKDRSDITPVIWKLRSAVTRIERQLRDLSDIDHAARGDLELVPELFDLHELGDLVVVEFSGKKHGVRVEVLLDGDVEQKVFAPRRRVEQVLENLTSNAVRYTPEGLVTAEISFLASERAIRLVVRDTGPGIAADELGELWRPFVRGRSSRSDSVGRGLGLAIVQSIVRAAGGSIEVSSEVGKGTEFRALLPAISAGELAARAVLVIDDDPDVREALVATLAQIGVRCQAFATGPEALAALHSGGRWWAALIDLQMTPMSGEEVLAQVRKDGLDRQIDHVFAMSANARNGGPVGFDGFLEKPIHAAALRRVVGGYGREFQRSSGST